LLLGAGYKYSYLLIYLLILIWENQQDAVACFFLRHRVHMAGTTTGSSQNSGADRLRENF